MNPRSTVVLFSMTFVALLGLASALAATMGPDQAQAGPEADTCVNCHADGAPAVVELPTTDEGADEASLGIIIIENLSNLYGPVPFDHANHAEMSEMSGGCSNCHHGNEDGTIAACRTCHAPSISEATLEQPSLKGAYHRQCLGCHRDWTHANACGFCHEQQVESDEDQLGHDPTDILTVPHKNATSQDVYVYETEHSVASVVTFQHRDHFERYGLKCVDCHRGDSCARCHDAQQADQVVASPTAMRIDHLESCCNCHMKENCGFCHDQQQRPRFDHATSAGWSLEPHHDSLRCAQCHGEPRDFRSPSRSCGECHSSFADEGGFDHGVTGVPLLGSHAHYECQRCHAGGQPGGDVSCRGCHADKAYPPCIPGKGCEESLAQR
jgi:hypothetical protein